MKDNTNIDYKGTADNESAVTNNHTLISTKRKPITMNNNNNMSFIYIKNVGHILIVLLGCFSLVLSSDEYFLNENSVVMITGAAGFLGSELALALHHTYSPKTVICVDSMAIKGNTKEELALFEYQRQRVFHVLQTLGAKGKFYRVDFRPMIPEYFDLGEVPVLDHIFREHPDISHVVHLADAYPQAPVQVIPRDKEVPQAGMMEALLEQIYKVKRETGHAPHFTYASSSEVYPANNDNHRPPFTESKPISTPSSVRGATKLIDEILAKMYYDMHSVYSVGLRFFSVYGPWGVPSSALFEMAERAVTGDAPLWDTDYTSSIQDYVYIDDAVDVMMTAMQLYPGGDNPHPIVINVASGEGTSLHDVAKMMQEYFPRDDEDNTIPEVDQNQDVPVSFGSTERAQKLLGFVPQVSLRDGIVKLLAWHFDRAFPYGGRRTQQESNIIASKGIVSCHPYDKQCLKAAPVFPCASECSHEAQCISSFYDDVVVWTQSLTSGCETVLYTVALDDSLAVLPSAHHKVLPTSRSFLDGPCNLAFVSEASPLVQSMKGSVARFNSLLGGSSPNEKVLKHGEWILVPLYVPANHADALALLPKLSPGLFFGPKTKRAIYCDPDIILDSIPKLLQEASMQPYSEEVAGATSMLIGKGQPPTTIVGDDFIPKRQVMPSTAEKVQTSAYRMVRIAVMDELSDDGSLYLDSRWMVHTLQSEDSRLFRCDVYGEVIQWEVGTSRSALEFILGLHDMWSLVIAKQADLEPWWVGDAVVTVPEGASKVNFSRRRLQEGNENGDDDNNGGGGSGNDSGDDDDDDDDDEVGGEVFDDDEVSADAKAVGEESGEGGGFDIQGDVGQKEVDTTVDQERGASSRGEDDDDSVPLDEPEVDTLPERDLSAYDTWMGVLSSTDLKYFVRIVPSSEVGVVSLSDDFNNDIRQYY